MFKPFHTLLLLLVSLRAAVATPLPDIEIPFEKHVLPNGLTLIIHEDHKAPVVAVNVWYHVGSKDERPGRTGFAHLFEHLMFYGSENHPEFFRPLEAAGATKMNGTTWLDRTNYFQNVPTSALDLTLWLESDRMGHLLGAIDQKKLDDQRGVVQNEKRQGQNRPYGKVDEITASSTYPAGHPYSWETIGSMEDLNAASLDDVKEWFRTWYGAANAVLVVAGDVSPVEVKRKVEQYFGDIAPGPVIRRQTAWTAKMSGEKRAVLQDRVPQARIYKTWNVPGYRSRDFVLLDLTADVFSLGKNSRLYKRLVYTDQTATGVQAYVLPTEIGSQLQVVVTVKPGEDVAAVEKALDEELARYLRTGPTAAELERIRFVNYAAFARNLERIDGFGGKSAILAESEVLGGSPDFYRTRWAWYRAATPQEVRSAAQRWLSDGVFVLNVQPTPDYKAAERGLDRSKLPAVGAPPALKLPVLERMTLSNGLKVVLAERHEAPVVNFQLIVDAGQAADEPAKPGTARLALIMLDEGTATRNALQIAERAESIGAALSVGSSLDASHLTLNAITPKLGESLELFADVVLNPSFPTIELERLKKSTLAAIEQEKADPSGIVGRVLPRLLYGDGHAYASPSSGTGSPEVVAHLSREDLETFYARWFRPDNATLLVVGDTTLEDIAPLLEKQFGRWKAPAEPLPRKALTRVELPARPRVFLINRTAAEQSLIVAGYPGPTRADPQHIPLVALNAILGGNTVSRLNMNLRESKGWAYGAGSGLSEAQGQGRFVAQAAVQVDRTADAMREILKELRDIVGDRKPTEAELRFARDSLVLQLPGENETTGEVAASYANVIAFALPDSYWNDFVDSVNGLQPAQVEAAAATLVKPDALTWLVVGDLGKIEDAVRKLELGEVQVLDVNGKVLR
jgi:zinc protease